MKLLRRGLPAGRQGFTLIEILIVVSIIILLSMIVLMNLRGQAARAMDSKRKTDLYTLRKVLEDYYNDHGAFPVQSFFDNCGGEIASYIGKIPCDPATKSHYGYFRSATGGYRICAKLADTTDPAIVTIGCTGPFGCGVGGGYNYCLTSGVTASAVGTADEIDGGGEGGGTPTPGGGGEGGTPGPTLLPENHISCTLGGDCNWYDNPSLHGCTVTWPISCPPGACNIPENRCSD